MRRTKHGWIVGLCALSLVAAGATTVEEWSYHGDTGPEHWSETFPECACPNQSPIDVATADAEFGKLPKLVFQYDAVADLEVENNGHTVQASVPPNMAFVTIGEGQELRQFQLLQFHWHTASEHHLDGAEFPLEIHLVHMAADGTLAVVGFFVVPGEEHEELAKIFDDLPELPEEGAVARFPYLPAPRDFERNAVQSNAASIVTVEDFDLSTLLPVLTPRQKLVRAALESLPRPLVPYIPKPPFLESFRYDGSLTTPPCSEGVKWHVMAFQMEMSDEQIAAFREIFFTDGAGEFPEGNRRPVQPLNDRVVSTDFPRFPSPSGPSSRSIRKTAQPKTISSGTVEAGANSPPAPAAPVRKRR